MAPVGKSLMECEDRLSKLPDSVMPHILSRLPTTDAVATCVLSKDWRYKWTGIYNVDIDECYMRLPKDDMTILFNILRKILLQIKNHQRIQVHFYWTSWLKMRPHLSNLLNNTSFLDNQREFFVLHNGLVNTISLTDLSLQVLVWKIHAENHFPNLISLKLGYVILHESSNARTLIFTLPAAKEISLENCSWSATKVEIHAPMLKSFMSSPTHFGDYTISILGAKLEKFSSAHFLENFTLTGSTVVSAALENVVDFVDHEGSLIKSGLRVRSLLKQFSSSIEELTLSLSLVEAIQETRQQGCPLSVFQKLRRLVLCTDANYVYVGSNTTVLFVLLHAAPFLKTLVIKMEKWEYCDYGYVEPVPSCIISNLEAVELWGPVREVIDLAKFMLGTGAQLKRFEYVIRDDHQREDDVREKLLSFSRASTNVSISVRTQE